MDAKLTVREIPKDSAEYEAYMAAARESILGTIVDAGFLDIEIRHSEEKIEPRGPVKVAIKKLGDVPEGDVSIVHFQEDKEINWNLLRKFQSDISPHSGEVIFAFGK